jgi:chlorite dismutase
MTTATQKAPASQAARKPIRRQFVSFATFQIDPEWRKLSREERDHGKEEFERVINQFVHEKKCIILSYSLIGTRADADMMLWIISYELENIHDLTSKLLSTKIGPYLRRPLSFLAMTKRSTYIDRKDPEHQEDRVHILPGKYKYLFVYPFVKKREWYALTQEKRQEMMDEHIMIGNKYPSVKLNTTYSFGLDDQEFVVAFESDVPADFLDLVQELRESKASAYTLRDTPILTGLAKSTREMLDCLGG